jgi:maleylacetate reductase
VAAQRRRHDDPQAVVIEPHAHSLSWLYEALDSRALFGVGRAREAAAELQRLGGRRTMLIASSGALARNTPLIDDFGDQIVSRFSGIEPHCPIETVYSAVEAYRASEADSILTIGGGSAIGIAKNLRMETGAASVVIPTTYSGSEMTQIVGAKVAAKKQTQLHPRAKPQTVIYDPDMTLDLPPNETATTGMNGLAHCVEALYPNTPNPIAAAVAQSGIEAFFRGLPASIINSRDIQARADALYGGFIGGLLVQVVGVGLHHRICHVLGGRFDIPHGVSNSVILPFVADFNRQAILRAIPRFEAEIEGWPGAAIQRLARRLGTTPSLRAAGIPQVALRTIAEETLSHGITNPRPVTVKNIEQLLSRAWSGASL